MPQRLKSLDLQGYKTFANRTRFVFGPRITAIVGPNGSGKSNIADALRWVLGEQSYALLRAHKTEDMIFAGSSQRPRSGMAAVTVTFDNEDHWLPIDYTEVALTRRAARDGQNEYLLNGQKVRLRDLRELLGHAGLSEHTYTFIGQGLVDAALALRPDERRQMLEGAAGIGVYRQRREETLRRLDATRRNLERVQDILAELTPRLRRLERQARRSREAAQLQADLELMLREWYGYHWHAAQQRLAEARQTAARQEAKQQEALARQQESARQIAQLREKIAARREALNALHRELAARHRQMEALARETAVLEERRRALQTRRDEWLYEKEALEAQIRDQQARIAEAEAEIARLQENHTQALQQREQARLALEDLLNRRRAARRALEDAQKAHDALTRKQAASEARLNDLARRRKRLQTAYAEAQQQTASLQAAFQKAQAALQQAAAARQQAETRRGEAQRAVEEARAARQAAEEAAREARRAHDRLQADLAALQAQARVLADAEASLTGYAEGTRWLVKQARQKRLPLKGALGQHLQVPAELETAIAAALDRFTEAVLLETGLADAPLGLGQNAPARTVLLPLRSLHPAPPLQPPDDADLLGVASRLVQADDALRPAVEALLGRVLVVRNRAAALRILPHLPADAWVVTLEGEAFSPQGAVITGKPAGGAALRRTRERRELAAQLEALQAQAERLAAEAEAAEQAAARAREAAQTAAEGLTRAQKEERAAVQAERRAQQEAQQAQRALEIHQSDLQRLQDEQNALESEAADLQRQRQALDADFQAARQTVSERRRALQALDTTEANAREAHWSTQAALAAQALEAAQRRLQEQQRALDSLQQQLQAREKRLQEAAAQTQTLDAQHRKQQAETRRLEAEIARLNEQITPVQEALQAEQKRLEALEAEAERIAQTAHIAERHHTQAQLALTRAQEALNNLRRRIEEDLGLVALDYEPEVAGPQPLPLEGMVGRLPRVASLPEGLEQRIKERRAQLRRLGPVNPEAEQEYQEVQERHDFLTAQLEDLRKAEADIRQVISELETLMEEAFRKTYAVVNREFSAIFTRLFGGGTARLVLTEAEDITRTGVEIEARLPGKRTQRLAMLSGGERSLTAVALIFALLKASPTPFCVLDEVDAMLDEANVGRFRGLLEELSEHTQFIVITHNRNTVQAAEVIYGVTLAPDATSQVMSLKLDEVAKMKGLR